MPPPHPVLEADGVFVRFPDAARDAVRDVSLRVETGSILAVLGPSGSGKSTLALALAGAVPDLVPASLTGTIRRFGETGPGGYATTILQDTDSHLVALSVEDEIAFALENRGLAPSLIDRRIDEALDRAPVRGLGRRDRTLLLSGGWRQRLAIGAALAEKPALLVADEPIAHLDADAAAAAEVAFASLARDGGGCVLAEHRADSVARLADVVLVLGSDGAPVAAGATATALFDIAGEPGHVGIRLPAAVTAGVALQRAGLLDRGWRGTDPDSLLRALSQRAEDARVVPVVVAALGLDRVTADRAAPGPPLLRLEATSLRRNGRCVLAGIDMVIGGGEVVGLAGANGAGKTSLALLTAGALRPRHGRVWRARGSDPAFVPQNPALALAAGTLAAEAARRGLPWAAVAAALAARGIAPDPDRSPLAFSHGERRRIALALALAHPAPRLVILDEPGSGLDATGLLALADDIAALKRRGCGVLVIAHDLDWLAGISDRIAVLADGRIVAEGAGARILGRALSGTLPVQASEGSRLARRLGWVPDGALSC